MSERFGYDGDQGLIFDRTKPCDCGDPCDKFEEVTIQEILDYANSLSSKLDREVKRAEAYKLKAKQLDDELLCYDGDLRKQVNELHGVIAIAAKDNTELQSRLDSLTHEHEALKATTTQYHLYVELLDRLEDCELSLSVFDPGGSSEYWLRHPTDRVVEKLTTIDPSQPSPIVTAIAQHTEVVHNPFPWCDKCQTWHAKGEHIGNLYGLYSE